MGVLTLFSMKCNNSPTPYSHHRHRQHFSAIPPPSYLGPFDKFSQFHTITTSDQFSQQVAAWFTKPRSWLKFLNLSNWTTSMNAHFKPKEFSSYSSSLRFCAGPFISLTKYRAIVPIVPSYCSTSFPKTIEILYITVILYQKIFNQQLAKEFLGHPWKQACLCLSLVYFVNLPSVIWQ